MPCIVVIHERDDDLAPLDVSAALWAVEVREVPDDDDAPITQRSAVSAAVAARVAALRARGAWLRHA